MREYYTEAFYARILNSNTNYKANAQRIHPPQYFYKNLNKPEQFSLYKNIFRNMTNRKRMCFTFKFKTCTLMLLGCAFKTNANEAALGYTTFNERNFCKNIPFCTFWNVSKA